MHEINVLPIELSWLFIISKFFFSELKQKYFKGGYPDLNWELTVPHTAALPIELHPPLFNLNTVLL